MLMGIQMIGIAFGVFMLYYTFLHYKRNEFKLMEFVLWMIFWTGLTWVAISPNSLDFLVKKVLSLSRPLDFFMIVGFLFMIFMTFFNYISVNKIRKRIERMVSEIAINNADKNVNSEKKDKETEIKI